MVSIDVGEQGAEAVLRVGIDTEPLAHLAEGDPAVGARALAEVEQVAYALVTVGEPLGRLRNRRVHVDVTGHEQVGPAVAVDVADGGPGVPAVGVDPRGLGPSVNVPSPPPHSREFPRAVVT